MDAVSLQTLRDELREDCRVALDALQKSHERFARKEQIAYEASAHQLCRMYNAIEQMSLRVTKAFENNIDDEQGWHSALLTPLAIRIEGVRPALLPQELKAPLRELKAFRHVFVHAYELELDPDKLLLLLKYGDQVGNSLVQITNDFVTRVSEEQEIK